MNGSTNERQLEEPASRAWDFDANGIVIHFSSDGSSTDLRISVDDATLHSPDEAPLFVWEWSMVFGAGSRPDCAITSSVDAVRVLWQFDCDPEDRLAQAAGTAAAAAAPTNALSWAWNWLRPQLPGWSWDRNDLVLLPACGPTCAFLLDFRWLSLEPTEASAAAPTAAAEASTSCAAAVEQTERGRRDSHRLRESMIEQVLIQSGGEQSALQEAFVTQFVTAHAAAGLADARNVASGRAQQASQTNRAISEVTARAEAEIVQLLAQTQTGEGSLQTQAALQTASTSQLLHAGANSTAAHASNWDVSLGGSSTQASTSSATATGALTASTWQVIEQEQQGNSSEQLQIAGQLADTVQDMEILAAAGVADARISTRLNGDSADSASPSRAPAPAAPERGQPAEPAVPERRRGRRAAGVLPDGVRDPDRLPPWPRRAAGGTLRYFFVPVAAAVCATGPSAGGSAARSRPSLSTVIEPSFVPVTAVIAGSGPR